MKIPSVLQNRNIAIPLVGLCYIFLVFIMSGCAGEYTSSTDTAIHARLHGLKTFPQLRLHSVPPGQSTAMQPVWPPWPLASMMGAGTISLAMNGAAHFMRATSMEYLLEPTGGWWLPVKIPLISFYIGA